MNNWYDNWTDITYPIAEGCPSWPDQPPVRFETISHLHCGDAARVSILHLSAHTNTHMDAPNHFLADGKGIDHFPIAVGMGPARVASLQPQGEIRPKDLEAYEARTRPVEAGERLLLRTQNSDDYWPGKPFDKSYLAIGNAAADWLAERKIKLVGVDYLSVGPYETTIYTHQSLLSANIWIVEGLDLSKTEEGEYELICLPLNLSGCDGSPVRALLKQK